MKRKGINFVQLLRNYKSGWVAISQDFRDVVSHGKNLKEVMKKTKSLKEKVYYFPANETYSKYVGNSEDARV